MHQRIKDLHIQEQPRQRLLNNGVKSLSNTELVALLLRTGTKNQSVLGLSAHVLKACGGLSGLVNAQVEELTAIEGIGPGKACQLQAAFELSRRLYDSPLSDKPRFSSPEDVFNYVGRQLKFENKEHFLVIGLNTKNEMVGRQTVSIGTLNQTLVHPREVFNWAIKNACASIIIAHNHPSGNPQPSREDLLLTERMVEAGKIIGIKVVDHIILAHHQYYSLKANDQM